MSFIFFIKQHTKIIKNQGQKFTIAKAILFIFDQFEQVYYLKIALLFAADWLFFFVMNPDYQNLYNSKIPRRQAQFFDPNHSRWEVQFCQMNVAPLLTKPYVTEVTLRERKWPYKTLPASWFLPYFFLKDLVLLLLNCVNM